MQSRDISVIVPVYNVEEYLDRCLESIINQDSSNYEVIIVDDGSTDNSGKIADSYSEKYAFITTIHKKNAGLGFARNTGLEYAKGKYILFVDSDDYIETNMLSVLYEAAKKNDADVCYSDFFRDYGDEVVKNNHLQELGGVYEGTDIQDKIIPWMIGGSPNDKFDEILGWGVWKALYSNEVIKKNGVKFHSEREMISEDIIFQLDFLKFTSCAVIVENSYYHYCLRKGSLSAKYRSDRLEKYAYLYDQELKRLNSIGILKQTKIRADRMLLAASRVNIMMSVASQKFRESLQTIKRYEDNEVYSDSLENYPVKHLPFKQKIFAYCLKHKMTVLVYLVSLLYVKKSSR